MSKKVLSTATPGVAYRADTIDGSRTQSISAAQNQFDGFRPQELVVAQSLGKPDQVFHAGIAASCRLTLGEVRRDAARRVRRLLLSRGATDQEQGV